MSIEDINYDIALYKRIEKDMKDELKSVKAVSRPIKTSLHKAST